MPNSVMMGRMCACVTGRERECVGSGESGGVLHVAVRVSDGVSVDTSTHSHL